MTNLIIIFVIIICIAIQSLAGYYNKKIIGLILPLMLLIFVVFLFFTGNLKFSFSDIMIPLLGIFALLYLYENGSKQSKKKIEREIEITKAKDIKKDKELF